MNFKASKNSYIEIDLSNSSDLEIGRKQLFEDMKQHLHRSYFKWIVKLTISIIILIILFNKIPLHDVIKSLASISLAHFLMSIFLMGITLVCMSLQIKLLLEPHNILMKVYDVFRINMITLFYNLVIPGQLAGSAIRWFHLQKENQKRAEVAATILFNRLVDTLMLVTIGLAFWILDFKRDKLIPNYWMILTFTVCILLFYLLAFSQTVHKTIERLLQVKLIPVFFSEKMIKIIRSIEQYDKKEPLFYLRFFFFCLSRHFSGILSLYFIVQGLKIPIQFISIGWIRSVVIMLLLLPISVSGFGVREVSIVYFFGFYGVLPQVSIAFSLLMFARGLFFSLPGGYFEFKEHLIRKKNDCENLSDQR